MKSDHFFGSHIDGHFLLAESNAHGPGFITIDEIMQTDWAKAIFLSSFCVDFGWLLPKLSNCKAHVLILMNGGEQNRSFSGMRQKFDDHITLIFPPFRSTGFGVFHAKIMLIQFQEGIRLAVTSANLMPCDYELYDNNVFVQDLYYAPSSQKGNELGKLLRFLRYCMVDKHFCDEVGKCDWTRFRHHIVYSVPRKPETGLRMLHSIAATLPKFDTLEYQCSSLGALTKEWVDGFNADTIKIVFPSASHVQSCSDTIIYSNIFYRKSNWLKCQFKADFYKCVSVRHVEKPLHSKIMIFSFQGVPSFVYMGSHNFTPSAWGRVAASSGKYIIANYEFGIIVADPFALPIPYCRSPLQKHEPNDQPWCQE
jgi:tyrosyl-DNA phosphodiesterase-1